MIESIDGLDSGFYIAYGDDDKYLMVVNRTINYLRLIREQESNKS